MQWEKFKNNFHPSYWSKMQKWVESKDCDKLYSKLKERSKMGHKIAPSSYNTWRIFKELPLDEIKVIIIGMDPYNKFINGSSIADGISMSCSITEKLQPSLEKFYCGIENELYNGLNLSYNKNPDLLYLVKQGIFLGNSAYSVECNKPGSHISLWEPFQKYFFEEIVGYSGIPILLLGQEAQKLEKYITPFTHVFTLPHPVSASYTDSKWETLEVFGKINKIIKENNNFYIKWLDEYS